MYELFQNIVISIGEDIRLRRMYVTTKIIAFFLVAFCITLYMWE